MARGADLAFEEGCDEANGAKEIFLPWPRYEGRRGAGIVLADPIPRDILKLAKTTHPAWSKLSRAGQKLHARNGQIILGHNLAAPCAAVLCWAPPAGTPTAGGINATGGTAQGLRIAHARRILIINLREHPTLDAERVVELMELLS